MNTKRSPKTQFQQEIMKSMAKYESQIISERIKRGLAAKKNQNDKVN